MDTDTIDVIEEEEEQLTRPSSWAAAIAQLPGYTSESAPLVPQVSGATARQVTSEMEEDLAGDEEPAI